MRWRGDGKGRRAIFLWVLEERAGVEDVLDLGVELFHFGGGDGLGECFEDGIGKRIVNEMARGKVASELKGEIEI